MPLSRSPRPFLVVLAALGLLLSACGDDDAADDAATTDSTGADTEDPSEDDAEPTTPSSDGDPTDTTVEESPSADVTPGVDVLSVSEDLAVRPEVEMEGTDVAPTEVESRDIVVGEGEEVLPGASVEVQYLGLLTNGEEFDSSWSRGGEPAAFPLSGVIPGWTEGIPGMQVGGRRLLVIPSDLAYGPTGSGEIPPNATLVFVVDMVSVENPPEPGAEVSDVSTDTDVEPTLVIVGTAEAPAELQTEDIVEGDGAGAVDGSTVAAHYVLYLTDGTLLDSSWEREPHSFELGADEVIEGWDAGVAGMQVGGRRVLILPSSLAYGESGTPDGRIPPDSTLIFVVDLVSVE